MNHEFKLKSIAPIFLMAMGSLQKNNAQQMEQGVCDDKDSRCFRQPPAQGQHVNPSSPCHRRRS
jgi:hypothetical protein